MPTTLEEWLRFGVVVGSLYVAALWVTLTIWTFRDIVARTRDLFLRATLPLIVAVFGIFGLPLYLLLRPPQTLAEQYDRSLEEEALLRDMEDERACPTCKANIQDDYLLCPICRTQLRAPCPRCSRPLNRSWQACPYCGYAGATAPATIGDGREA